MNHAHKHYLDTPNGPTSEGICECGDRRTMLNSVEVSYNPRHRGDSSRARNAARDDLKERTSLAMNVVDGGQARVS